MKIKELVNRLNELDNVSGFDIKDQYFTTGVRRINALDVDMIVYAPYGCSPVVINLHEVDNMEEVAEEIASFVVEHSLGANDNSKIEDFKIVAMEVF